MGTTTLTDARIRALKPGKSAYDIREGRLKGFGVRVLPSGGRRFFIHCWHEGRRVWRTVGDAAAMDAGRGALAGVGG